MRDIVFRFRESLVEEDLETLERVLTDQLTKELRCSPDGLAIRYPLWLVRHIYSQLPKVKQQRVTMVKVLGNSPGSVLVHLDQNECVILWLVEAMAERHETFKRALRERQLSVLCDDNTQLLRMDIHWDESKIPLHECL